jgi:RimJ/RimL family protein N-acetyltransferase
MEIESDRLSYRPLTSDDWEDVLRYRSDPAFLRFYEDDSHTPDDARALLNRFLLWDSEEPQRKFAFAVLPKGTCTVIGVCSLRRESVDRTDAEIGFELATPFWGRGLATEMGRKMLWLGFDCFGLHRIQAHCLSDNVRSRRVLERIGLRLEGRFREKHLLKGQYVDELWFGILRAEWTASQGNADKSIGSHD